MNHQLFLITSLPFHSFPALPIVHAFHQHLRKVLSALTMKGFVVRKYKPLYQPHALHPLVHFFIRSVQQSGGGLDAGGHKSHNHLCPRYFYNILHNATFKKDYLSPQKYKSFLIQQKNRYENSWLSITLPINRTNASIFPSISLFCLAVISLFCFAVVSLFCKHFPSEVLQSRRKFLWLHHPEGGVDFFE